MLRTELIDLINSGEAWAFVGAGISVDAGGPTWQNLVTQTVDLLGSPTAEELAKDQRFQRSESNYNYETSFSIIEQLVGRASLEAAVRDALSGELTPGKLASTLTDWPFAGYITTNYDSTLEGSLANQGQAGWVPIGNANKEPQKLSGNPSKVVWHVHGSLGMDGSQSQLILTERDYDDLYLEESATNTHLKAFLLQRRIIFFGYGFQDFELNRLLKLASRYCSPARPAYAFLSGLAGTNYDHERHDLLEKYNVDVIPYSVSNESHRQLQELFDVYNAFVLRRSLHFGKPTRTVPSYDPETTSLLTYNQLVLRHQANVSDEGLELLLRARILSMLEHKGICTSHELEKELAARANLLHGQKPDSSGHPAAKEIARVLSTLMDEGLVSRDDEQKFGLTPAGLELVSQQAGRSALLSAQFKASLRDRAQAALPDRKDTGSIAETAEAFLKECIRRRALGVSMSWKAPQDEIQQFHAIALLQSLPEFMEQLEEPEQARALIKVIQGFLASPSDVESKYLGASIQAQFSLNLLGYDPNLYMTHAKELAQTLFLIDSDTLIRLLGRSGTGYTSAHSFVKRLIDSGSTVATTDSLSLEVAEHARWPIEKAGLKTATLSSSVLIAATGRAGFRSNVFLEGFLNEVGQGDAHLNYGLYLDSIMDHPQGQNARLAAIQHALAATGVLCRSFGKWEGFSQLLFVKRDEVEQKIAEKRRRVQTYRHTRQVKAEAEALLLIEGFRKQELGYESRRFVNAYFVSHSRVVDRVSNSGLPITMRPEVLAEWLNTLTPVEPEELTTLIDGLLWELSERDFAVVDVTTLRTTFSPLVQASKEHLEEELAGQRNLIATHYGEAAKAAFRDLGGLDLSIALESLNAQRVEGLEEELAKMRSQFLAAMKKAQLTPEEQEELAKFRAGKKAKKLEGRSRKRASQSKPTKRGGKGRRRK